MDEVGRGIPKEIKVVEGEKKVPLTDVTTGKREADLPQRKIVEAPGDPKDIKVVEGKVVGVKAVKTPGDVMTEETGKLLVDSGGGKVEVTQAQADAEAYGALEAAKARVADIPGAKAWIEETGSGTREVKTYVPDEYKALYDSRK